jgi:uncharacterized membrane protein
MRINHNVKQLAGISILIAVVAVLQVVATYVRFGPVSITLALFPMVIGAAMYGKFAGALLGGVFGVVVLIGCINGADIGGHILWGVNPFLTAALCMIKGIAAGFTAGYVYAALSKLNVYARVTAAAVLCPVINTGIFIAAMILFYRDTLVAWAGETHILYFAIIGMTGINFLLEFTVNVVLAPTVTRIINAVKRPA